jgi:hypothetical protein
MVAAWMRFEMLITVREEGLMVMIIFTKRLWVGSNALDLHVVDWMDLKST